METYYFILLQDHSKFQAETCSPSQLDCVTSVSVEDSTCVKECEGIVVDIVKTHNEFDETRELETLYREYEEFKTRNASKIKYPGYMKGVYSKSCATEMQIVLL